jgi:hypothetical protein
MLIHSVYFWFKASTPAAVLERFEDGLKKLTTIKGVDGAFIGTPEATTKRPVIDDSYAWALLLTFADVPAHDRYQDDPIHHAFLEEFRSSWERVQVYDVNTRHRFEASR